jgi:vacuolar-type H+-ATPase subunit D/Vma8
MCEHTFVTMPQLPTDYLRAVTALKESLMRLVRELDPESTPMEEVIDMLIEIAEFEHSIKRADAPADA